MENKRLGLIYSGLCLALVFSVSSVEAANQCEPCERCDQDGDTFIKDSQPCRNKCGLQTQTEFDPNDTDPDDPAGFIFACPVGEDGDIGLYTVTLTGAVDGGPAAWRGSASEGSKTISIPVFNPGEMMLDLVILVAGDDKLKDACFPEAGTTLLSAAQIHSKNVQGQIDEAIGMFWFDGKNDDDTIEVSYVLQMFGIFLDDDLWPGDNIVTFLEWKMKVEKTSKGGRKSACTSEGMFNTTATVIQTNP